MTIRITSLTVDCRSPEFLARFWAELLGWHVVSDDDPEVVVAPHWPNQSGTDLLFIPVPEEKLGKNRIHFDLVPTDMTRDEQVGHAIALGASVLNDRREPDGTGWVVMLDPEGNEFCILRSDSEREPHGVWTMRVK